MKKSDFSYDLPPGLIAQVPLVERSASRLLCVPPPPASFEDRRVRDLPMLLAPGDLLVFNNTRVLPARLFGHKASGGKVEILLERILSPRQIKAQLRASKPAKTRTVIAFGDDAAAIVLGREGEFYWLEFSGNEPVERIFERLGRMPLPPYISRPAQASDDTRYQTVFATQPGAAAAPTAGLHFDAPLLAALAERGVDTATVTLHVGAGTFQPLRVERLADHAMHSEWLNVDAEACGKIAATRARGRRVVAVGTTVVRALETAWRDGQVRPFAGETQLFLYPGHAIRSVDALLTNFHLPESTLLMLVCAFAGQERILSAYRHAVEQRYRFFSYGDAMFLWRK